MTPGNGVLSGLQFHPWAFPALEAAHLVGVALLLGNLFVFEIRLLGLGSTIPAGALARLALPCAVAGFSIAVPTGLLMFATQATDMLANPAFLLKMLLIVLAGLNALWFHARGSIGRAAAGAGHDPTGRVLGIVSLLLWIGVLACGRAIAYV
jgi:hypothetical protein